MDTSQNDVTNNEILQHLKAIEARISKLKLTLIYILQKMKITLKRSPSSQRENLKQTKSLNSGSGNTGLPN